MIRERPFLFDCEGQELVGIVSDPAGSRSGDVGLLVVVGGPQYRAGSHRMFTELARHVAAEGFPSMRFDVRGMGDGTGAQRRFDTNDADIRAAIDAFLERVPELSTVVLWGLCDGASAACMYDPADTRVAGAVLVNPWVRTPEGEAQAVLKHYYRRRIFSRAFWTKVVSGRVRPFRSLAGLVRSIVAARGRDASDEPSLADRMARGLIDGGRRFWLILSGRDLVAQEFEDQALPSAIWQRACRALEQDRKRLPRSDHTMATEGALEEALAFTSQLLKATGAEADRRAGGAPARTLDG